MDSIVFRKAVKNEAILRNLPFEEVKGIEDEDISDDDEFINPADARETAGESGLETDAVFGNS
jgi:hypothetical protein